MDVLRRQVTSGSVPSRFHKPVPGTGGQAAVRIAGAGGPGRGAPLEACSRSSRYGRGVDRTLARRGVVLRSVSGGGGFLLLIGFWKAG